MKTLLAVLAALVLVPAASAAYPTPYAAQGTDAVLLSPDGSLRYVALKSPAGGTRIEALGASGDAVVRSADIAGSFGIPALTYNGVFGGLFHDGSAIVLQSVGVGSPTRFAIVGTQDLALRETISLRGAFGFDAVSPDGSTLYLIQHTSTFDFQHYVVRAYDLGARRLLPGRIADKTQKSWVMQGEAVARTATADGRWIYTLYMNPGGYPFVHALDTVHGVAHCVGIPWQGSDQTAVSSFTLALQGGSLLVQRNDGSIYRRVDRRTWRVFAT